MQQLRKRLVRTLLPILVLSLSAAAQTTDNVLVLANRGDPMSRQVGDYYCLRRAIAPANVCDLDTPPAEEIAWQTYQDSIERPTGACLTKAGLQEKVLYIVATPGIPLKMTGGEGGPNTENASVDSELALLYAKLKGARFPRAGWVPNPFFGKRDAPFRHPAFPIYLVTRLGGWDAAEAKALIDRGLLARNRGKFVIDLKGQDKSQGNDWLRNAAMLLPADRVLLNDFPHIPSGLRDVIAYAGWGTNDSKRRERFLGFQWLPGAIVSDYVSTNGRTLQRPPDGWTFQIPFAGWQQNLSADYLHEGATGASGNVYEPYLGAIARPDYLLPAYFAGRNLAESYYLAMPFLSWQGIVLGDPLCSLGKP
jgi:uncharacterized protein (TIGR03790 family)